MTLMYPSHSPVHATPLACQALPCSRISCFFNHYTHKNCSSSIVRFTNRPCAITQHLQRGIILVEMLYCADVYRHHDTMCGAGRLLFSSGGRNRASQVSERIPRECERAVRRIGNPRRQLYRIECGTTRAPTSSGWRLFRTCMASDMTMAFRVGRGLWCGSGSPPVGENLRSAVPETAGVRREAD
jgi:hypothetical protein